MSNSFTAESILDTKYPGVIEILGTGPGVAHQVSGTLHLHVQKAVQFKELSVAFLGAAYVRYDSMVVSTQSDAIPFYKTEFYAIDPKDKSTPPKTYLPGDYTFPFQLSIPSDLAVTDCTKLKSSLLLWGYDLATVAVPTSSSPVGGLSSFLFQKRKRTYQPLTLQRVMVEQSGSRNARFGAKRDGEFESSLFVPRLVNVKQSVIVVGVQLKAWGGEAFKVKEIHAQALQIEKIVFDSKGADNDMIGVRRMIPNDIEKDPMSLDKYKNTTKPMVDTTHTKVISEVAICTEPIQQIVDKDGNLDCIGGPAKVQEFEVELFPKEMIATESLAWVNVSHVIKFTIVFEDPTKKSIVVKAPFAVGHILDVRDLPISRRDDLTTASEGLTLPGYGADMGRSTLLDSNFRQGNHRGSVDGGDQVSPTTAGSRLELYDAMMEMNEPADQPWGEGLPDYVENGYMPLLEK